MKQRDSTSAYSLAFTSLFLLVISLSILAFLLRIPDLQSSEKRKLAQFPEKLDGQFFTGLEEYFNDRFPLRNMFISSYHAARSAIFREKVFSSVVMGKEGWLYYIDEVSDYQHIPLYTPEQLSQLEQNIEAVKERLGDKIVFVVVVAPNKSSIYPEHMPDGIQRIGDMSRMDQVVDYLKTHTSIHLLDLRQPLLSEKQNGQLYFTTDTHWNNLGAVIAYRETVNFLREIMPLDPPLDLGSLGWKEGSFSGDLARMLALDAFYSEITPHVFFKTTPKALISSQQANAEGTIIEYHQEESQLPNVLIFGDSFTWDTPYLPFLAQHFHGTYFHSWPIRYEIVDEKKPDIVIFQIIERSFWEVVREPVK